MPTKSSSSAAVRFIRRHSGAQIVFDVQRQMACQLFRKFALASLAIDHSEEPYQAASSLSNVNKLHRF